MGRQEKNVTRRTVARMFAAAAAVPVLVPGEIAASQVSPQTAPAADAELRAARETLRSNAQRLAQVRVPMNVEPAFRFKA